MTPEPVLDEWFGPLDADGLPTPEKSKRWWVKSDEFDAHLREHFEAAVQGAQRGRFREWDDAPEGILARILLLDQFARNVYRDTPKMYDGDALALEAAQTLLATGLLELPPVYQYFALMPLMHAEDLREQERSVREFEALVARTPEPAKKAIAPAVQFAKDHRDVVATFSRFPHRNKILGRTCTPDESAYLLEHPGW